MKYLYYFNLFFIFQPYVGISIFPSDIQPFALLTSILIFVFLIEKNEFKIPTWSNSFFIILLFAAISLVIQVLVPDPEKEFLDNFRYFIGYLTPFFVTVSIYYIHKENYLHKIIPIADFILYLSVFGIFLNLIGFTNIIQLFVNRAIVEDVLAARGFSSFYPEQSRVPEQMSFLFFIYLLFNELNAKRIFLLFFISLLSFAGQFFIQIGIIIISFLTIRFFITFFKRYVGYKKVYSLFSISLLIFNLNFFIEKLYNLFVFFGLPNRGIVAIYELSKFGISYLSKDIGFILKTSGFIASIAALFVFPINFEIGSFSNLNFRNGIQDFHFIIQSSIYKNQFPIIEDRSGSPLGTWIIDFGILGASLVFIFIFQLFFKSNDAYKRSSDYKYLWIFLFLLFMLFIKLPLANPSSWGLVSFLFIYSLRGDFQLKVI